MEKQKLPNATIALVLAIVSYIACCFSSGLGGIILSGIALYLANKDKKTYLENPELYDNYGQVKTAYTLSIIGLVLAGLIIIGSIIALISLGGWAGYQEYIQEAQRQYGGEM